MGISIRTFDLEAVIGQSRSVPLGHRITVADGIGYTRLQPWRHPGGFRNPFVATDPVNAEARKRFGETMRWPAHLLGGVTDVTGHLMFGEFGTLLDAEGRTVPAGFPLHYDANFAAASLRSFPARIPPFAEREPILPEFELNLGSAERLPPGILIAQPGSPIYGHWLLDIAARLETAREIQARSSETLPLYTFSLPSFADRFLDIAGFRADQIRRLDPTVVYQPERLLIPAPIKFGFATNVDCLGRALAVLEADAAAQNPPPHPLIADPPTRVYFSRADWKFGDKSRLYHNLGDATGLLAGAGFITIHPERHTLAELRLMLRHARMLVGEDGSALHNCFLAGPACRIVVICPTRRQNLWHGAFCAAAGQDLVFVQTSARESGDLIPLGQLAAACTV